MNAEQAVLYKQPAQPESEVIAAPFMIGPGITPNYGAGKRPNVIFTVQKLHSALLMRFASEPEKMHDLLRSSLHSARVCGFIPKGTYVQYWQNHVPNLRKLQQFEQIMTEYGLRGKCKRQEITADLANGSIRKENVIVGDTNHYHRYSSSETINYVDKKKQRSQKIPV